MQEDIAGIVNDGALQFIASLPPSNGTLDESLPGASPQALNLIRRLFCFTPHRRLTAMEALQHPYVTSYNDATVEQQQATPGPEPQPEPESPPKISPHSPLYLPSNLPVISPRSWTRRRRR